MKYIKQFAIIVLMTFLGECLNLLLPLPVPASIYGMVLLFVCLQTGIIKLAQIEETADLLLGVMPIVGYGISTNSSLNADTLYDYIAELGINTITFSSNEYSSGSDSAAAVKQDLQLAEQKGIKLYVRDDHLLKGYSGKDEQIAGMPSRVGEYSMYQSFLGMYIADEPQTVRRNCFSYIFPVFNHAVS